MLHLPRRPGPRGRRLAARAGPGRHLQARSCDRPATASSCPTDIARASAPTTTVRQVGRDIPDGLEGPRHRPRDARPSSATSSARPAPCSGTARWACSRTTASRRAPAPSPRRWPTAAASPSSAAATAPAALAKFGLDRRHRPRVHRRRRVARAPRAGRPARPRRTARRRRMPELTRKPLISGNWKMHHNHFEAIQVVQKLSYALDEGRLRRPSTCRCTRRSPTSARCRRCSSRPHPDRRSAPRTATGRRRARSPARSARRCWPSSTCAYVIVGHSERRELFGETDELVNKKVKAVLEPRHDADPVRGRDARGARGGRHRGQGRAARSRPASPA